MVARTSLFVSVFCLALSPAVLSFAAKADPRVLTTSELAAVTAGRVNLPPIQINVNTTVQVARATAISIAICAACNNATVTAFSDATAFNLAELTNLAF
jgi:cobalamin biosynthesis protein CobT